MSIEQRIAAILAESKVGASDTLDEGVSDGVTKVEGENADNDRNNVGNETVGGKAKTANKVTAGASAPEGTHISSVSDGVTKDGGANPDNARNINTMKEDIDALVEGAGLTEEFKEKAATIFEAAVSNRVKQEIAKLDEAFEQRLEESVEQIKEGLVEKVDGYLDYVVEQWMTQNEIALESGMKSDILEGFVGGLKSLFEDHYIDVPQDKFDVMGDMEDRINTLSTKLDEQVAANVAMSQQLTEYEIDRVTHIVAEGLVDTDKEKFFALVEGLEFDGVESFARKAQTIRESYFTNKATTSAVVESVVTDSPVTLIESAPARAVDPSIRAYVSALDKLK